MSIERDIALWYEKFKPLKEFEAQDQTLLRLLTQEITTLIKTSFVQEPEMLPVATGFLVAMGLQKLFALGDEVVKESVRDLLLERLHADPRFLQPKNQDGIEYANAPLFVVLTEVMKFKDLFKYEPHATLLSQLTVSVSDSSYWVKEEAPATQVPVENNAAFFTMSRAASPLALITPDESVELLSAEELERRLGLA